MSCYNVIYTHSCPGLHIITLLQRAKESGWYGVPSGSKTKSGTKVFVKKFWMEKCMTM